MDVPAAAGGLAVARLGARAPMLNVKHHMRTSRSVTSTAPMSPDSPLSILPDLWHPPYELHRQRAARFALALPLRGGESVLPLPACLLHLPHAHPQPPPRLRRCALPSLSKEQTVSLSVGCSSSVPRRGPPPSCWVRSCARHSAVGGPAAALRIAVAAARPLSLCVCLSCACVCRPEASSSSTVAVRGP